MILSIQNTNIKISTKIDPKNCLRALITEVPKITKKFVNKLWLRSYEQLFFSKTLASKSTLIQWSSGLMDGWLDIYFDGTVVIKIVF